MEKITLKSFVSRLNPICTQSLESAAGLCVSNGSYEITVEHFFLKLLESEGDIALILAHYDVNIIKFVKHLQQTVEKDAGKNTQKPVFSKVLVGLLEDAWLVTSLEMQSAKIRSGSLILAILANTRRHGLSDYVDDLSAIPYDALKQSFREVVQDSKENQYEMSASSGSAAPAGASAEAGDNEYLTKYCVNFTQQARDGRIDPVFCRDREIRQMVDILARRRKNNPICVGEAGVGKTSVVEGLALKIVEGDVPDMLKNVDLVGLDLSLLQAGASVKGEFENRLTGVINAVKSSEKPIIMFIDEAHTLIGAGGAAGSGDAANILKPALARGELRTIAATTWSEYKKYFEKDPALARRFQLVKLDEPTPEQAVVIIRGLRKIYEKAHGVYVRDDAVVAAAQMSARYINGRQLPDKAVDVLDTAAARVKISIGSKPDMLDYLERDVRTIQRELDSIQRDIDADVLDDSDQVGELAQQIEDKRTQIAEISGKWEKELECVNEILSLRQQLAEIELSGNNELVDEATPQDDNSETEASTETAADETAGESAEDSENAEEAPVAPVDKAAIKTRVNELKVQLTEMQGDEPLVHYEVDPVVVGEVISNWTGIPVGKMVKDQATAVLTFADELGKKIKGQSHAIASIDQGVRAAKAGINNPDTPIGVFLFVGPSGVGKTETCIGVADLLFGGERYLTSVNMSEFQEKHSVSRLIGSPPGYVGFGEGGMLTEAVRQKPYSVVLLDEVEKADLEVLNLFYQVFDKGVLSDGEGQLVDFKNTVMFLTSNLATDIITDMYVNSDTPPSVEEMIEAIKPTLSAHFKPALLARMKIVPFYPIGKDVMSDIVKIKLNKVKNRLEDSQKLELFYDDAVIDTIASRCTEVESGARNVDHIINGSLLPKIATEILEKMTEEDEYTSLTLSVSDEGEFEMAFA